MKKQKITASDAAEAVQELQEYIAILDRYALLFKQGSGLRGLEHAFGKEVDDLRQAQKHIREAMYQKAGRIASLVAAVYVDGFYLKNPQLSGSAVHIALGIYERIETGAPPPEPPVLVPPEERTKRHTPFWATALIGVITGGFSGFGASYIGAFYGTKQTCLAGDEEVCVPYNGIPYVRLCKADGLGYGDCLPLSETRPPVAAQPTPATLTSPTTGGSELTDGEK